MRHRGRDEGERYRGRSSDREPRRSRDRKPYREREREPTERSDWKKDNHRGQYPPAKLQERDRNPAQTVVRINRKQTCPFLVRIFYSINKENIIQSNVPLPQSFIYLHLWMDCTLREVGELLKAYIPSIRTKQRFQFWRVSSQQEKPSLSKQEMGTVMMLRRGDKSEDLYLSSRNFKIGDMMDVSIYYK